MTDQEAEQVLIWYNDLENHFADFTDKIPLSKGNRRVYLPLLAPLIVEAGSLIDTVLKEEYVKPPKPKKDLGISDYAFHYEANFHFSKVRSLLYHYPPTLLNPFKGWTDRKTGKFKKLKWWADYNKIKHHRIEQYNLANLDTTINILCALQQVISLLPTFTRALWRNNLLTSHSHLHMIGQNIEDTQAKDFALIETKLFATPTGYEKFPAKIDDISPFDHRSERLAKFLGRW